MDKPRANTAVAHKLARMIYFMLTRGEDFVDKGQHHYEEQQRQRSIAALRRRAANLGFAITPAETTARREAFHPHVSRERGAAKNFPAPCHFSTGARRPGKRPSAHRRGAAVRGRRAGAAVRDHRFLREVRILPYDHHP
jgi:hypothetical protein